MSKFSFLNEPGKRDWPTWLKQQANLKDFQKLLANTLNKQMNNRWENPNQPSWQTKADQKHFWPEQYNSQTLCAMQNPLGLSSFRDEYIRTPHQSKSIDYARIAKVRATPPNQRPRGMGDTFSRCLEIIEEIEHGQNYIFFTISPFSLKRELEHQLTKIAQLRNHRVSHKKPWGGDLQIDQAMIYFKPFENKEFHGYPRTASYYIEITDPRIPLDLQNSIEAYFTQSYGITLWQRDHLQNAIAIRHENIAANGIGHLKMIMPQYLYAHSASCLNCHNRFWVWNDEDNRCPHCGFFGWDKDIEIEELQFQPEKFDIEI